jgi:7,8-dihydropterin-6-yl-methyl-4-(beta-D-ribofuranosyl)aminobenzene 5'-phosphate synthase
MKVTIVYDNELKKEGLKGAWGFSSLIETEDAPLILFDTGGDGSILLHNMKELGIDPKDIGMVVISHDHWDHTGGLSGILKVNEDIQIYVPNSFSGATFQEKLIKIGNAAQIVENVFSTGELGGIEQSLALKTERGITAIVGCSHPGVGKILDACSKFGKLYGIVGGFHGFREYEILNDLSLICPCHCTQHKSEIRALFPDQSLKCGVGVAIEL